MKPNFFIVGTPKAGTTSLYHYLDQHPQVFLSPIKETNYFSYHEIKEQGLFYNEEHVTSLMDYEKLFKSVTVEKAIGEASVSYLFYPLVPKKIKEYNPEAKIIVMLRNPVERGLSHYLMDTRLGFTKMSYDDIINRRGNHKNLSLYYQQYISLGLYHEQLLRYFTLFGKDKVKVILFEEVTKNLKQMIKELYTFLEVDSEFSVDIDKKLNTFETAKNSLIAKLYARKEVRKMVKQCFGNSIGDRIKSMFFTGDNKPVLPFHLKQKLVNIYEDDVLKTSQLLNKDLTHWLH